MKILVIIDVAKDASLERVRADLPRELAGSWKLFAAGILREAYATSSPTRVVFVLEAEDAKSALDHLHNLPMVAAGLVNLEVVELRPFVNWSALFAP